MADPSQDYLEIAWREAFRAIKRKPHREVQMRSLESRGPLKKAACDLCRATHVSTSTELPTCTGGSSHSLAFD